jgi:lipoprotein-anchoring transpeptidase ErfK/SrfK
MKKRLIIAAGTLVVVAGVLFFLKLKAPIWQAPAKEQAGQAKDRELFAKAKELEGKNEILSAKEICQKLIQEFPDSPEITQWQKKVEELNIRLLFSATATDKSTFYEIKLQDTLAKIANEFNTTVELLMESNSLSSDRIIPGRKLKVWREPFVIFIDKSQNILILKTKDEEVIKTYTVSTGVNNSTPAGSFKISEKILNPPWFKAGRSEPIPAGDPENILGTRWIGFNLSGYGIHGTTDPQSLGKQVTQGCVRMSNADVEELYIIVPKGTEVIIVD